MGSAILKRDVEITSRAEKGFERKTFKDFAHFLDLAKGSCGEVRSMLYVAEDLHYITTDQVTVLREFGRESVERHRRLPEASSIVTFPLSHFLRSHSSS